jgi:hypothetical protein
VGVRVIVGAEGLGREIGVRGLETRERLTIAIGGLREMGNKRLPCGV